MTVSQVVPHSVHCSEGLYYWLSTKWYHTLYIVLKVCTMDCQPSGTTLCTLFWRLVLLTVSQVIPHSVHCSEDLHYWLSAKWYHILYIVLKACTIDCPQSDTTFCTLCWGLVLLTVHKVIPHSVHCSEGLHYWLSAKWYHTLYIVLKACTIDCQPSDNTLCTLCWRLVLLTVHKVVPHSVHCAEGLYYWLSTKWYHTLYIVLKACTIDCPQSGTTLCTLFWRLALLTVGQVIPHSVHCSEGLHYWLSAKWYHILYIVLKACTVY